MHALHERAKMIVDMELQHPVSVSTDSQCIAFEWNLFSNCVCHVLSDVAQILPIYAHT
eukprot:COSAG01_NODE_822_length_13306_cov_4.866132_4_plen_58_part_00